MDWQKVKLSLNLISIEIKTPKQIVKSNLKRVMMRLKKVLRLKKELKKKLKRMKINISMIGKESKDRGRRLDQIQITMKMMMKRKMIMTMTWMEVL